MRRVLTGLLGTAMAGLLSCSTPSVPIPPPEIDLSALTFGNGPSGGTFTLSGMPASAHASAEFFVIDEASGDGVVTKAAADGSFTSAPFAASLGDTIRVQLEVPDGRMSDAYCVTLATGTLQGDTCP